VEVWDVAQAGTIGERGRRTGGSEATEVAASTQVLARDTHVTLVEGSSFCVSDHAGDIGPTDARGLFVRDTRLLSRWELYVDGERVQPLTAVSQQPFACRFLGRVGARPGRVDTTLVVERRRFVGQGMREDLVLHNHADEAAAVDLVLAVDGDFADLFEVKEQRAVGRRTVRRKVLGGDLLLWLEDAPERRGLRVTAPGGRPAEDGLTFRAVVPAKGSWTATVEVVPSVLGEELAAPFPVDRPVEHAGPSQRMRGWQAAAPEVTVGHPVLDRAVAIARRDLGALRILDPEHPEDDVVAAGAPWFMALFGRDSLLTGSMMLPFFPELALGTLRTLARLQGRAVDVRSEEEPGRILHEVRLGVDNSLALGGEQVYCGSIDSTPLFVMLVGEALRWGAPRPVLEELVPAVDAALRWIEEHGDRDGDGLVEYQRGTDRGLLHQGWKDSFDAISFSDGRQARPPIALAEVQGYCYAAYLAGAELAEAFGRSREASRRRERAAEVRRRFHEAFWMPDREFYAVALDADKEQVDTRTSNIGQCLWTGVVDDSVARVVADRLMSPELFTGFGIRTLASDERAFNPVSYHNGSVWPHDSVLAAAGLARYGFADEAERLLGALLDAAEAFGGRLPELFCGFSRDDVPVPVPYPTSCSPQAWAAAVPFQVLRTGLGLRPDTEQGTVLAERMMPLLGSVEVRGLRVGGRSLRLTADEREVAVEPVEAAVRSDTGREVEEDDTAPDSSAPVGPVGR